MGTDREILALHAETGHVRWTAPLPNETAVQMSVADDNLLVAQSDGTVLAYDQDTGEKRWQFAVEWRSP